MKSLTRAEKIEVLALMDEQGRRREARALERQIAEVVARADEIRTRCRKFSDFVKEAWHILEPSNPLRWSWHLDAMCDHLEAITFGLMSPWLIINVSPGSSKSMIVSVLWQAWEWGPCGLVSHRFVSTSFEEGNVKRDTRKTRDLIASPWFQALWPDVVMVRAGELSFANSATGTREGVPFASITGKRGDRFLIDDPHSLDGAESEAERTRATRRFLEGGMNRLNDQVKSAIVIVMQRLHEADLTGVLLAKKLGFVHLCIPMEFEADRVCETPLPWRDPRDLDGELMDPGRMPEEAVDKLKRASAYSWAGQYQQRPAPREGGLFRPAMIQVVPAAPAEGSITRRTRAWDFAASKGKGDYTAAVKMSRCKDGFFWIENVLRDQAPPEVVREMVINTAARDRVLHGENLRIRGPQDPGQAGKSQAADFTRALAGFTVEFLPVTGPKEVRATPFAAQVNAGNVRIVEGVWNDDFLTELGMFPGGLHDDQVDAATDAFNDVAAQGGAEGWIQFYKERAEAIRAARGE